ncbi:MAG: hypothetical protein ACRDIY_03240, partial [Chloroflexota bacterium]
MTRIARPEKPSRAERLYARWLHLYPSEHRRAYGPLMLQAFRDSYRDARDTRGKVAGDFWLAVVGDAVISLAREYDVVIRET